ncbi:MAG: hypothetical protein PHD43_08350 [Methylococcales bacterium]|nr:hypothetical protein [Methylococcales bacterium]
MSLNKSVSFTIELKRRQQNQQLTVHVNLTKDIIIAFLVSLKKGDLQKADAVHAKVKPQKPGCPLSNVKRNFDDLR